MAPRPTKKSPGSTTPQPPPRPDLPVQARHPPPPGLPATAPRPTAVVGRVAELMGGKTCHGWTGDGYGPHARDILGGHAPGCLGPRLRPGCCRAALPLVPHRSPHRTGVERHYVE